MTKKNMRQLYQSVRNNMSLNEIRDKSSSICNSIFSSSLYKNCASIFTYINFGSEVETLPIIKNAWMQGKKVCVPKINPLNAEMRFFKIENFDSLIKNNYGILEPDTCKIEILPDNSSVFFVPGLVFDYSKNRIGYGKGYYDSYLSKYNYLKKIGLAYDIQMIEKIIPEKHDIKLDYIVTESQWIK